MTANNLAKDTGPKTAFFTNMVEWERKGRILEETSQSPIFSHIIPSYLPLPLCPGGCHTPPPTGPPSPPTGHSISCCDHAAVYSPPPWLLENKTKNPTLFCPNYYFSKWRPHTVI